MTVRELIAELLKAEDLDGHAVIEVEINPNIGIVYRTAEIESVSFYPWGSLLNCKEG